MLDYLYDHVQPDGLLSCAVINGLGKNVNVEYNSDVSPLFMTLSSDRGCTEWFYSRIQSSCMK